MKPRIYYQLRIRLPCPQTHASSHSTTSQMVQHLLDVDMCGPDLSTAESPALDHTVQVRTVCCKWSIEKAVVLPASYALFFYLPSAQLFVSCPLIRLIKLGAWTIQSPTAQHQMKHLDIAEADALKTAIRVF